jgi:hypothetical protein
MVNLGVLSMGLGLTSLITQSSAYWHALFRTGVQSKFRFIALFQVIYLSFFRCLSPCNDLDGRKYARRCRRHTAVLLEELQLGALWNEYGLVGDVIVSLNPFFIIYIGCADGSEAIH